ncbi:MAG: CDP-alcohol phosphatidyltransferase family protein [Peptococcaceae bacterium]|nr:CDP-alcohol phosphatidyltransferase family protein [Peptococcaceae bacterium]
MMPKPFIGYYNIANGITFLGLLSALASSFFALGGQLKSAVICLICAGIFDLFDGAVARKIKRTEDEKAFGVQLDTVVDVVSFCVTPAIVAYTQAGSSWYALVICGFYILCGVIRLAYFNTLADSDVPVKHYQGLPVTYISLILPIVLLFSSNTATITAMGMVAVLFIANIRIPKPRGIWYILFPVIALGLSAVWWRL